MATRPYNETEELKRYVWRHYSDVVKPHQCIPRPPDVESALPAEYRELFCRFHAAIRNDEPSFQIPSDAETAIQNAINDVETANFNAIVGDHEFDIHRCSQCSRILQSPNHGSASGVAMTGTNGCVRRSPNKACPQSPASMPERLRW